MTYTEILLHKTDGSLTDDYFQTDISVIPSKVYCVGKISKGEYIGTSTIKGVCQVCYSKALSIGISQTDKQDDNIGIINVIPK